MAWRRVFNVSEDNMDTARRGFLAFVLICAFAAVSTSAAAEETEIFWTPVGETESEVPMAPAVKAVDKPDSVKISFEGFGFLDTLGIDVGSETDYTVLSVPGCGQAGELGDPAMPFKGLWIEIPYGVDVEPVVIAEELSPSPKSLPDLSWKEVE
jgi:hypothetical protein